MKLRCLVVDDEPLARAGIANHIQKTEGAELVQFARNAAEAAAILATHTIDLMFLDINMPGITGLEFMKRNQSLPPVIIITAYPDFALEGYELDVIDYLVKPVELERFQKAFRKAADANLLIHYRHEQTHHFLIRTDGYLQKIFFNEVLYFESMLNYVKVITKDKTYITYASLKNFETELPANLFIKIHKSYIVAVSKITSVKTDQVMLGNLALPISRNMRTTVREKILALMQGK